MRDAISMKRTPREKTSVERVKGSPSRISGDMSARSPIAVVSRVSHEKTRFALTAVRAAISQRSRFLQFSRSCLLVDDPRQPKVTDFESLVLSHEKVLALEVAVHAVSGVRMEVRQRTGDID